MSPTDIAYVTTRLVSSDAQGNYTAAVLASLRRRCGGRVALYTFAYERPPIEGVEMMFLGGENRHGIGTNFKAFLRTFATAKALATYDRLVLAGPDIGALPAVHLAKRYNPRLQLIWVYHGLTPAVYLKSAKERLLTRSRRWAYTRSMKRSDRIKSDSRYSKAELASWGVDPAKVTVIPIGVELSRFSPGPGDGIRSALGFDDQFILLYVGRLASGKRVDNLVRAMAQMKDEPVALVIVGGGPEKERIETVARELGVDGAVRLAGRVPDAELPDYYHACDVWISASEHEGFCVPIVEAMACGKPVIVPDVTAMPETAGEAGLVYRQGDSNGLVDDVRRLMADRPLYDSLVVGARKGASMYDMDSVIEKFISLITDGA